MSYSMKFAEEVPEDFIRKISFHMLQIALSPEKSIDYTLKLSHDKKSCGHTKRVCDQLIERICKFKEKDILPDIANLKFAAAWMRHMNFQDSYVKAAGTCLAIVLSELTEMGSELPAS